MKVSCIVTKAIQLALALSSVDDSLFAVAQTQSDPDKKTCTCNPDPHFRTWDGTYYDYHGGCTLVLVHVPDFLDVFIETVPVTGYSFISKVGLKVGTSTWDTDETTAPPTSLNGYPFTETSSGSGVYELSLDNGQYVRMTSWNGSWSVIVYADESNFGAATGMCGTWSIPGLIDRSGTELANGNAMGLEWKASADTDDDAFFGFSGTCEDAISHRTDCGGACDGIKPCVCDKDGKDGKGCGTCDFGDERCPTTDAVEKACADTIGDKEKENCIFDIEQTGNLTWAEAPFYIKPQAAALSDSWCDHQGKAKCEDEHEDAQCVFNCVPSENFMCIPGLCEENDTAPDNNSKGKKNRCACRVPHKNGNKGKSKKSKKGKSGKNAKTSELYGAKEDMYNFANMEDRKSVV